MQPIWLYVAIRIPFPSIIEKYIYNTSTCSVLPLLSTYNLTQITGSFRTVSKWLQVTCMTATGTQLSMQSTTSRADPRFMIHSQSPSCDATTANLLNQWVIQCNLIGSGPDEMAFPLSYSPSSSFGVCQIAAILRTEAMESDVVHIDFECFGLVLDRN